MKILSQQVISIPAGFTQYQGNDSGSKLIEKEINIQCQQCEPQTDIEY
uniref:Uncharacterized protein n=1 Tax=Yersinia enterocolitica W22703 TaxID=913028 RepID=F4N7P4_YEREN|nr:unknown protein [Yersinia enterocolitica W22703]